MSTENNFIGNTMIMNRLWVRYTRADNGLVHLAAMEGNHAIIGQTAVITREEFAGRPRNPYDSEVETKWALEKCGTKQELSGDEIGSLPQMEVTTLTSMEFRSASIKEAMKAAIAAGCTRILKSERVDGIWTLKMAL